MRNLMNLQIMGVLIALLCPAFAHAQQTKPIQLADYVSLCLAVWSGSPDVDAKASALGLQNGSGVAGARITIGKSTLELYKSAPDGPTIGNQTLVAVTTTFADGKDLSCDVTFPFPMDRIDIETMAQTLHLDGQILTLGAATLGRWEMPDRRPPVFVKAILPKSSFTMNVQAFETTAKDAAARQ
jgi:hypothetical protein